MELQTLVQYKNKKRRERAARMAEEAMEDPVGILDDLDSAEEDTDLLKLKPPRPPRPKKVKELLTEPLYEEDIIEGFSFCSFKVYEDLDVSLQYSEMFLCRCILVLMKNHWHSFKKKKDLKTSQQLLIWHESIINTLCLFFFSLLHLLTDILSKSDTKNNNFLLRC